MRVLQVEDDALTARGNEMVLKSINAVVDSAVSGGEALEILRACDYDILIVDLGLPDIPGEDLVRKLRTRGIETPVAILTGHDGMAAKMAAFAVGVDDFITKPVAPAELIARVRAIVRRNRGFCRNLLREGELELDQDRRQVTVSGRELKLTKKEYELLELLLLRRGRVVSRNVVLDHLYGGGEGPVSRTVEVFLCYLRRKLAAAGLPDLIRTVSGVGYTIPRGAEPDVAAPAFSHDSVLDCVEPTRLAERRQGAVPA
jgi:two-component system cell cycle response regulator CtrA